MMMIRKRMRMWATGGGGGYGFRIAEESTRLGNAEGREEEIESCEIIVFRSYQSAMSFYGLFRFTRIRKAGTDGSPGSSHNMGMCV